MIQADQHIIYISPGQILVTIKQADSMRTGMQQRTVVVTTKRIVFFNSLVNQIQQLEYQLTKNKNKPNQQKPKQNTRERIKFSINSYPQASFPLADRDAKLIIEQEQSLLRYFEKVKIKNLIKSAAGIVLLRNVQKLRFEIMIFDGIKGGFRFCKALVCAKAWGKYELYCKSAAMQTNKGWIRILTDLVSSQNCTVLIDPDYFANGTENQIKAFIILIKQIGFAHSFQHRYHIKNSESANYAHNFIESFQNQTFSLIMSGTGLSTDFFGSLFDGNTKLTELMDLQLQNNKLTDEVMMKIVGIMKQSKKLSNINLGHNLITMMNSNSFLQLLKHTKSMLRLSLDHNLLADHAVNIIQKYLLFAINPPLQQLDLSYNKFTQKGAWRLYVGHTRSVTLHPYFNFILYPIPCKKDIFPSSGIGMMEFPKRSPVLNYNLHSALVQQFQQQSIMKHTFQNIIDTGIATIRLVRQLKSNIRLPKNKQQVSQMLNMSNKIENFIYESPTVQKILRIGQQMAKFDLNLPPITRIHFTKYLMDKLNEALFIRDHYAVHYILKTMKLLQIDYSGYIQRLNRLEYRDTIYKQKVQDLFNFNQDQEAINNYLDEMCKEGLRLYLQGDGVNCVYYLRHLRNKYVQKLLAQKFNPDNFIFQTLAKRNIVGQQRVSQENLHVPYEIKVQKRINQNFYTHPWQTNYVILSQLQKKVFEDCIKFIQQSSKRDKFAVFFQRIEQRIQFIRNQFIYFFYHKFKVAYSDLKINCCRLIFLYHNINQTNLFLEIPIYFRKKPITRQKIISVKNSEAFVREYHIVNYLNLNFQVRKRGFYNFQKIITKYQQQIFKNQAKNLLFLLNQFFINLQRSITNNEKKIYQNAIPYLKKIINLVRSSVYPQQLKQQFYLHIIGWRKGKRGNNTEVVKIYPFLTMYLKPPLTIQKYLVASILQNEYVQLDNMPLCLVSDINKPTENNIIVQQSQFIQRDWLPSQQQIQQLIENNGKLQFRVQLLNKKTIKGRYPESFQIINIIEMVLKMPDLDTSDSNAFWIYKCHKQSYQMTPLFRDSCLGEVLVEPGVSQYIFILKRRIYSPQLRYILDRSELQMVNSLYHQIKFQYLKGQFYVDDKSALDHAALMLFIDVYQAKMDDYLDYNHFFNVMNKSWAGYIPKNAIKRLNLKADQVIESLKVKISQRVLKKHHLQLRQLKIGFIKNFQHYPQFLSTLYTFQDRSRKAFRVAINSIYIYLDSVQEKQKIFLQSLISVVPKSKYLFISYHKSQSLVQQIVLYGTQNEILNASMDILSYFVLRIRCPSNNLYNIVKFQRTFNFQIKKRKKEIEKLQTDPVQQQKQIYRKLAAISCTVINLEHLIYALQSKYIKTWTNRKLYANKAEKKMELPLDLFQQEMQESSSVVGNIFRTIFPQIEGKSQMQQQVQPIENQVSKNKIQTIPGQRQKMIQRVSPIQINEDNQIVQPPTVRNIDGQQSQKRIPKVQSQKQQQNAIELEQKNENDIEDYDVVHNTETKSVPPESRNKDKKDNEQNALTNKKARLPRRKANN